MALIWQYDYITTLTGSVLKDNEGKYVVLDASQVPDSDIAGTGDRARFRRIPRQYFYDIIGRKLVPVIFDYPVIFNLIVAILLELTGNKIKDVQHNIKVDAQVGVLKDILLNVIGSKVKGTYIKKALEGQKLSDIGLNVGLDGVKIKELNQLLDLAGKKLSPIEIEKSMIASKVSIIQLATAIEGLKEQVNKSIVPITGQKLNQLIQECIFKGKIDVKALLYLLFDDEGLENSNLIEKLTKEQLLVLLDEEENSD